MGSQWVYIINDDVRKVTKSPRGMREEKKDATARKANVEGRKESEASASFLVIN